MDRVDPSAQGAHDRFGELLDRPIDRRLDARGLRCPEPVLQARRALREMHIGQCLELWTDDPLAGVDLQLFCERAGHRWIGTEIGAEAECHWIVRGAGGPD